MKRMLMVVLATMVVAGNASALGWGNDNEGGGSTEVDVDQTVRTDVDVDTDVVNVQNQDQGQFQKQGQFQAQGNAQNLTIEDSSNPASSAPNIYLTNCTSGASAQGFGGGGSIGGPDDVCQFLNFAQVSAILGNFKDSAWAMAQAKQILTVRTNVFRRMLQALPLVGKIM